MEHGRMNMPKREAEGEEEIFRTHTFLSSSNALSLGYGILSYFSHKIKPIFSNGGAMRIAESSSSYPHIDIYTHHIIYIIICQSMREIHFLSLSLR